jgi:hypothetical protein
MIVAWGLTLFGPQHRKPTPTPALREMPPSRTFDVTPGVRLAIHEEIAGRSDERRIAEFRVVADEAVADVKPEKRPGPRPDDRSDAEVQERSGLRPHRVTGLGNRPDGKAHPVRGGVLGKVRQSEEPRPDPSVKFDLLQ